jgi:hypothetical protein
LIGIVICTVANGLCASPLLIKQADRRPMEGPIAQLRPATANKTKWHLAGRHFDRLEVHSWQTLRFSLLAHIQLIPTFRSAMSLSKIKHIVLVRI